LTAAAKGGLNGAQITSLLKIVENVGLNSIPRETGVLLIMSSFGFSHEAAESIMGDVGAGFLASGKTA
jgi:hypothetical protein